MAEQPASVTRSTSTGPGRVVVLVYGVFALAASARAGFQLATQFHEAPVAYLLSAFSAAPMRTPPLQPIDPLTEREEEVLLTVARGRTNTEIADELAISLSTVKTHLASLMSKLQARNRVELAMWAYETARVSPSG